MTEETSESGSTNTGADAASPINDTGVDSLLESYPIGGYFKELHPHQSDWMLTQKYDDLHGLPSHMEQVQDTRTIVNFVNQLRYSWTIETRYDDTADRKLSTSELLTPVHRANGIILGVLCGDALGRPVEFKTRQQIKNEHGVLEDMVGEGSHGQPAGTITDDSELALRLAQNVINNDGFDSEEYADQLVEWYESDPFDIGLTTYTSISNLQDGAHPSEAGHKTLAEMGPERAAGNGSLMRCAPLAIAYPDDLDTLQQVSREMSEITHADPRCTHGCAALNIILAKLLREGSNSPISDAIEHLPDEAPEELIECLKRIQDINKISLKHLKTTGYVLDTLETGLLLGLNSKGPEKAIVNAVNQGGDADTIGAVAGAVSGAKYGGGYMLRKILNRQYESMNFYRSLTPLSTREMYPTKWTDELTMPTGFGRTPDAVDSVHYLVGQLLERPRLATEL